LKLSNEVGARLGAIGNGEISYVLDDAANRLSRTSSLAAISSTSDTYDANDQLVADSYDPNGNETGMCSEYGRSGGQCGARHGCVRGSLRAAPVADTAGDVPCA